jgi:hypothetical protein
VLGPAGLSRAMASCILRPLKLPGIRVLHSLTSELNLRPFGNTSLT